MSEQAIAERRSETLTISVVDSNLVIPEQPAIVGEDVGPISPIVENSIIQTEPEPIIFNDLKRLYYHVGKSYGMKRSRVECTDCPKLRNTIDGLREMLTVLSNNNDRLEKAIDKSIAELEIQKRLENDKNNLLNEYVLEIKRLEAEVAEHISVDQKPDDNKSFIAEILNLADRIRSSRDGTDIIVAADEEIAVSSQSSLLPLSSPLEVTQTTVCVSDSQTDNEICSPPGTSASISSASINQTTDANSSNTVLSVKRTKVYARSDLKRKFLYKTIKGRSIRSSILNSGAVYSDDVLYMDVPASVSKFNLKFAMECIRNNTSERNRHLFHQYQKNCFWGILHEADGFTNYHFVFYKESSYWCPACAVALNTCPEWKNENVLSHAKLDHFPSEYTNCRLILKIV